MLDYSSCTRPPCLAIMVDMLNIYKKLVATSKYEIRLLPGPYTHTWPHLCCVQPVWYTSGDAGYEIGSVKCLNRLHHDVRFHRLFKQMLGWSMEISHHGQLQIGHVALYLH